jgi:hypothetical protein
MMRKESCVSFAHRGMSIETACGGVVSFRLTSIGFLIFVCFTAKISYAKFFVNDTKSGKLTCSRSFPNNSFKAAKGSGVVSTSSVRLPFVVVGFVGRGFSAATEASATVRMILMSHNSVVTLSETRCRARRVDSSFSRWSGVNEAK